MNSRVSVCLIPFIQAGMKTVNQTLVWARQQGSECMKSGSWHDLCCESKAEQSQDFIKL